MAVPSQWRRRHVHFLPLDQPPARVADVGLRTVCGAPASVKWARQWMAVTCQECQRRRAWHPDRYPEPRA